MARPTVIAGNWKMFKTIAESQEYIKELIPLVKDVKSLVYLAVPFTALRASAEAAKGSKIVIGAQNVSEHAEGAFTGEVAIDMVKEAGARFVIAGHSERRKLFHEDDATVNRKVKKIIEQGLQSIVCIGESLEAREGGQAEQVLRQQLLRSLEGISRNHIAEMIIAYEPIWAIGTGKHASAAQAEDTQKFCRGVIAEKWGSEAAEKVVIQYGGSVKPDNAQEFLKEPDIDGLLVGGASLSVQSFIEIIKG